MKTDRPEPGVEVFEELPQLLFELSHGWRLEILLAIKEKPKRHSDLSRTLRMSPQETTRHLTRLSEMKLIQKEAEGQYHLTNLGGLVLVFIPALKVISKFSDYFLSHDISGIPSQYILRLGELSNISIRRTDTMSNLSRAVEAIRNTRGPINLMNIGRLEFVESATDKHNEHLEIRCILPRKLVCTSKEKTDANCRYLEQIKIGIFLTDEVGALTLPDLEGKMDYSIILVSLDRDFKKWCGDLFDHYWREAMLC